MLTLSPDLQVLLRSVDDEKGDDCNITAKMRSSRDYKRTILNEEFVQRVAQKLQLSVDDAVTQIVVASCGFYDMVSGCWSFGRPMALVTESETGIFLNIEINARHRATFEKMRQINESRPGYFPMIGPFVHFLPDLNEHTVEFVRDLADPVAFPVEAPVYELDKEEATRAKTRHLFGMLDDGFVLRRANLQDVAVTEAGVDGNLRTRLCIHPMRQLTSASLTCGLMSLSEIRGAAGRTSAVRRLIESLTESLKFDRDATVSMLSVAKDHVAGLDLANLTLPSHRSIEIQPDEIRELLQV